MSLRGWAGKVTSPSAPSHHVEQGVAGHVVEMGSGREGDVTIHPSHHVEQGVAGHVVERRPVSVKVTSPSAQRHQVEQGVAVHAVERGLAPTGKVTSPSAPSHHEKVVGQAVERRSVSGKVTSPSPPPPPPPPPSHHVEQGVAAHAVENGPSRGKVTSPSPQKPSCRTGGCCPPCR